MAVRMFRLVMKWVRILLSRGFCLALDDHVDFGRAEAAAIHARDFESRTDVQGLNCSLKKFGWNSSIDKRPKKHVTADSGKAVEVGDAARSAVRRTP